MSDAPTDVDILKNALTQCGDDRRRLRDRWGEAVRERNQMRAQRDALAKAGDNLLWLHRLKRKIDAGTATDEDAETYRARKPFAWRAMAEALAALDEGSDDE